MIEEYIKEEILTKEANEATSTIRFIRFLMIFLIAHL